MSTVITFGSMVLALNPYLRSWLPKMWLLQAAWFWMVLYTVAVLVFTINTAKRTLNDLAVKVENDFYLVNSDARRDRAIHIFLRLHQRGKSLLADESTLPQAWQPWDQEVRKAMTQHCTPRIDDGYLHHTGRVSAEKYNTPLLPEHCRCAVDYIQGRVLESTIETDFN